MAVKVDFVFINVDTRSGLGAAVGAPFGSGAQYGQITLETAGVSVPLESAPGVPWIAPSDMFVRFSATGRVFVRFYQSGESDVAGPGAGWPLEMMQREYVGLRKGDGISAVMRSGSE